MFELVNASGTYTEKVLHSFTGGADGATPLAGLIMDASGNLYGTTEEGGTAGGGTVFKLANSSSTVSVSPPSLNFGHQAVGTSCTARIVTLMNISNSTVDISEITSSAGFSISENTCGAMLAAGKKCKVLVSFPPSAVGAVTGTLTFTDDAANNPQTVPLAGTGVEQAPLMPTSHSFPKTKIGDTSAARTFTLRNNLCTTLTGITHSTKGPFEISDSTCTDTLASGASCSISVTFSPKANGAATGSLIVRDHANNSPQIASLSGTGD
ncbi:MAG: choice-of-anchor D domain-containing protein [Mycobacterium sp.]